MDTELIFWIVGGIASLIALGYLRVLEKKDSCVKWIRDWEEYR